MPKADAMRGPSFAPIFGSTKARRTATRTLVALGHEWMSKTPFSLDETDGDALANEGANLLRVDPDLALELFMAARAAFLKDGEIDKTSTLSSLIARTWQRKGRLGRGLRCARRAVVKGPHLSRAWCTLARFYEMTGEKLVTDGSKRARASALLALGYLCYMRAASVSETEQKRVSMHDAARRIAGYASRLGKTP